MGVEMTDTENPRRYGNAPYRVVTIHGGPGAAGEMAPVSRELGKLIGVVEPLQTADTVNDQVEELALTIQESANPPVFLVGFSWGAWLAYLCTAKFPELVEKLILVASGPFEDKYAQEINTTRMQRLTPEEREEYTECVRELVSGRSSRLESALERLSALSEKADGYDVLPPFEQDNKLMSFNPHIFKSVWEEAAKLRHSGDLIQYGRQIKCPVVAIHGDYDPHPAIGVEEPLTRVIEDFRFISIEKCGHRPWRERHAREIFFSILETTLVPL